MKSLKFKSKNLGRLWPGEEAVLLVFWGADFVAARDPMNSAR